jgi:dienelactone hydrolase
MDTASPSTQEIQNRSVLTELSKNLKIRFAIPRAVAVCPTDPKQICWGWTAKTSKDISPVKTAIESAATQCFSSKNYSVLGFSNGGVAVGSFLRLCEKVDIKSAITVGAAGGWYSSDPQDLRGCQPKLVSMLGSDDHQNQKPVRDFVAHLISLGAPATLVEYEGGHKLLYKPLYNQLK